MAIDGGWLQDIEKIKEPETGVNIARSSVFGYLETPNTSWCNNIGTEYNRSNLSIFANDCCYNRIAMACLYEHIRNLKRQLSLEHRKRVHVQNEFQSRSATILKVKEAIIGHHQSVRRNVKTACTLVHKDKQVASKRLKLDLQEIDNFSRIIERCIVTFTRNTTSFNNRAKVQVVKAAMAIQFQIGHMIHAAQVCRAAVKALVMLEKRASVAQLLHPQSSTLPSLGESSVSETEGSACEIKNGRKTPKPPLGGYKGNDFLKGQKRQ